MSIYNRGYNSFLYDILVRRGYYTASCHNCWFYDRGCINTDVTEYDLIKDGEELYCIFWKPPPVQGNR